MREIRDPAAVRCRGDETASDPDTPYRYHCHLLSHENQGMMGQFVVVQKGRQAGRSGAHHH
ncbi:multicopper oxidase domain-containing protein [Streptomyces mutabilis]|uniref:multicopper oxidase domain-containing protein n=1 Tax=Streptomyces mutabilis TaxID=67332 RepID=UPI0033A11972